MFGLGKDWGGEGKVGMKGEDRDRVAGRWEMMMLLITRGWTWELEFALRGRDGGKRENDLLRYSNGRVLCLALAMAFCFCFCFSFVPPSASLHPSLLTLPFMANFYHGNDANDGDGSEGQEREWESQYGEWEGTNLEQNRPVE